MMQPAEWTQNGAFSMNHILSDEVDDMLQSEQPEEKRQKIFEVCGLQSRHHEKQELGSPDNRSGCFGCVYIGERDAAAVQYEDMMVLIEMIRKSIARTDPVNLSIHIARKYKFLQDEINGSLLLNEDPLPDWTAATILDHIRNHNTDPEIQTWMRMCELQELGQVALAASVEEDVETGEKRVVEKQAKMFLDILKASETLYKSDLTKKQFSSHGAHMDTGIASQGLMSISGKNVVNYWAKSGN